MPRETAASQRYTETNYLTADPLRLVVMMYEGAIRSLEEYKKFYQQGNYEAKAKSLNKVQDILTELHTSLNMKAGEIAILLDNLYTYMKNRLSAADLKRDLKGIDEVNGMLAELTEGWEGIMHKKGASASMVIPSVAEQTKSPAFLTA